MTEIISQAPKRSARLAPNGQKYDELLSESRDVNTTVDEYEAHHKSPIALLPVGLSTLPPLCTTAGVSLLRVF